MKIDNRYHGLKSGWLWFFVLIALVSFVGFAILTFDSLVNGIPERTNADKLTEKVVAGKMAFQKYNCNDCHTFFGIGGYYATDLTKIYRNYGDDGRELLRDVIMNPENYFGKDSTSIFDYTRRMQKPHIKKIKFISQYNPRFTVIKEYITVEETDRIIDYLKWVSEIDNNDWPPAYSEKYGKREKKDGNVSKGYALLKEKKCLLCHEYQGEGGNVGPKLNSLRAKFSSEEEVKNFIVNPTSREDDILMVPYGGAIFEEGELDELVRYLWEGK